jgi:rhodanese-related sulfurtransferase
MKHTARFQAIVEDAKTRVAEIAIRDYGVLTAAGVPHVLIDVREANEWAAGHASGAIHLSKGVIERDIETRLPDTEALLVLYCGGGYRSALAGDAIQKMGYRNVRSLAGGWGAWKESGLPVES